MVGLFKALPSLLLATLAAAADLIITVPSSTQYWVAKSSNVLTWDCKHNPFNNFTVLIANLNTSILPASLAFIAIQENDQCSIVVPQDLVNQPADTGYTILFANTLNNSAVYTTSELFEIKPLGSLYPNQVASLSSTASGTAGTTSSPSATSTKSGALGMYSPSFIGLAGVMGLLAAGILGA